MIKMNIRNKIGLVLFIGGINVYIEAIKMEYILGIIWCIIVTFLGFYLFIEEEKK